MGKPEKKKKEKARKCQMKRERKMYTETKISRRRRWIQFTKRIEQKDGFKSPKTEQTQK